MKNSYSLTVAYDGTSYFGWQKAKGFPTIQGELEKAFHRILQETIHCESASRTDRGVHATGQIVQFLTTKQKDLSILRRALNGTLPPDIRILEIQQVDPNFHPSLDARLKTYQYNLCFDFKQSPFDRKYWWHYPYPIDLLRMQSAAQAFLGKHDFTAFTTHPQENPIRLLQQIDLKLISEKRLTIAITGNRFLYKMARTIAGTLADIGAGKIPIERIHQLFISPDRKLAGVTAPAHGLTLSQVHYD